MPSSRNAIRFATRSLAGLAAVATASLMITAARPWSGQSPYDGAWGYIGLLIFLTVAVSPYVFLILAGVVHRPARGKQVTVLAITMLIATMGIAIMYDAHFVNPDAQSGVVFLVVPVYQWLIVGATLFAFSWLKPRGRQ